MRRRSTASSQLKRGENVRARQLSDAGLVARCRAQDQDAWAELVARFSRYVYAILVQGFRLNEPDAEELFQDVFTRAYERLDELRDDDAIRPWIGQLTRRMTIDRLRRRRPEEPLDEATLPVQGDAVHARLDEAMTVRDAVADLPSGCREVIDRFFVLDQSYETISSALGIPVGTIASRISRCLARLRAALSDGAPGSAESGA